MTAAYVKAGVRNFSDFVGHVAEASGRDVPVKAERVTDRLVDGGLVETNVLITRSGAQLRDEMPGSTLRILTSAGGRYIDD